MTVVIIIPSESDHHYDQASPPWSSLPPGGTHRPCSPQLVITMIRVVAYMQKTCDVAEKAILAKKNCGKSA